MADDKPVWLVWVRQSEDGARGHDEVYSVIGCMTPTEVLDTIMTLNVPRDRVIVTGEAMDLDLRIGQPSKMDGLFGPPIYPPGVRTVNPMHTIGGNQHFSADLARQRGEPMPNREAGIQHDGDVCRDRPHG